MQNDVVFSEELMLALFKSSADQPLTANEEQVIAEWLAASPSNQLAIEEIMNENWINSNLKGWAHPNAEEIWNQSRKPATVIAIDHPKRSVAGWLRYAAAILLLITGGWLWWQQAYTDKPAVTDTVQKKAIDDILPGRQIAMLTLSDGSTIVLDSVLNGKLANQGNTEIRKDSAGRVSYSVMKNAGSTEDIRYNTMSTPNGGQYQLQLPDGTKAHLNAASSITYPVAFTANTRTVKITGEVYFEVATNARQPFIVEAMKDKIQVLGTRFNVNAYEDEKAIKTTLIAGSVKVNNQILKPGEAYSNGKLFRTDTDQDIAWKQGIFDFTNVTVQDAMRQLARWYNIQVVFDEPVDETFLGKIGRNLTLNQVLKTIEGAGAHFRLEGKILHVSR